MSASEEGKLTLSTSQVVPQSVTSPLDEGTARRIKIGARLGVWGLVAALTVPVLSLAGLATASSIAGAVMVGGVVVSGLGIVTAAANVRRALPPGWSLLKVATVSAMPVGVGMAFFGISSLVPVPEWWRVLAGMGAAAAALGVVVLILLVLAFVASYMRAPGDHD